MAYGITATGFVRKTHEIILAEIEADQKAALGDELNVSATSVLGQVNGIISDKLAELWELAEASCLSFDPAQNGGATQDAVAAITGTTRRAQSRSTVTATVNLDAGTTIAIGAALASVDGNPSAQFRNAAAMVNSGGSAADVDVEFESVEFGPVIANAGTLTQIDESVTGWNSITNALDAVPGAFAEGNATLRLRREAELRQQGGGVVEAIAADVLALADVEDVLPLENVGESVDANGLPGHSFEIIVDGGDAATIASTIWANKGGGIETYGSTTESVTGEDGNPHDVKFTRPTARNVYLGIDVTVDPDEYPADGDDQIAAAVALRGDSTFGISDDVILTRFYAAVYSVSGVIDVTAIRAGFAASPTGVINLTIATRERAAFDSSRIVVNS